MTRQDCEVYVYDLEGCLNEIDDPLESAVIYSYRSDNPEHVLVMTGQLIGVATFGLSTFGFPSKISLQNGSQFRLLRHGRFVLIVGEISHPDDDSEMRVTDLMEEILDRLRFFRGARFDEWFNENPYQFKRRITRFLNAVLYLEVIETSSFILTQCVGAYDGVLCGALVRENKVLYQNFPRKFFMKLHVLLNEKDKSLESSFCKVYDEASDRLPIGLDVFSLFINPIEAKELHFAHNHFVSKSLSQKKTTMEEVSDAIRSHNFSRVTDGNASRKTNIFVLLIIKVDLLRLLLVMEMKSDKAQNMENIKKIWSIGFTKLPKLIDLSGSSDFP
ncbi:unnamed protein product [Lepeophtheirus salmonis]|uniref:(salmon louse) hypothetical protein n=1 Tax=Lepeophtheirus salmonis TaxID=72036 RepID=A0A7R8H7E6_LEPSM|nr:unnamed protein product [Lepeophtheirus salmonis]CAF2916967.1 unnamed protein product [Lepeophtheirus salmonis]